MFTWMPIPRTGRISAPRRAIRSTKSAASCCAALTTRAYPYHVVMMKHGSFIATEKTVKAQQTRPDGLSLTDEGYISNFRFGSQQSVTRNWHMPMHQTDTLFHKTKAFMGFHLRRRGGQSRRQHRAQGMSGAHHQSGGRRSRRQRPWKPGTTACRPTRRTTSMKKYLAGKFHRQR